MHKPFKRPISPARVLQVLFLAAVGVTMLFPFVWMISTSLKTFEDIFTSEISLIPSPAVWERYVEIWTNTNILTGFKNSILVALPVIILGSFFSSLAAFAFSKLRMPHGNGLFLVLLSTIMLPSAVVLIPQFVLFTKLRWVDTLAPLIVPAMLGNVGMIFFLQEYMKSIPSDLFEAGRIDGCNPFQLYSRIMLPIVKPALAVQIVMWFMALWNDFLGPVIYLNSPEKMTIQVVIANMKSQFVSQTDMGLLMTASVIAILPILVVYLFFQRYFVDSLALSGIKG